MTEHQKFTMIKNILEEERKNNSLNIEYELCTRFRHFISLLFTGKIKLQRKNCLNKAKNLSLQKTLLAYQEKYKELANISGYLEKEKIFIFVDGILKKCPKNPYSNIFETTYHELEHVKQEQILKQKEFSNPNYLRYLVEIIFTYKAEETYKRLYDNFFIEIEATMNGCARAYDFLRKQNLLSKDDLFAIQTNFNYSNHLLKYYNFMKIFKEYLLLCQTGKIDFDWQDNPLKEFVTKKLTIRPFDELDFDKIKLLQKYYNDDILDILTSKDMIASMQKDSPNKKLMIDLIDEKRQLLNQNYLEDCKHYYRIYPQGLDIVRDKEIMTEILDYNTYLLKVKYDLIDQMKQEQGVLNDGRNNFSR